jgi:DNA-binding MarR family transcriptional regulator
MCLRPVSPRSRVDKQETRRTAVRLSPLHKRILGWLVADHQRTKGMITRSHQELLHALQQEKSNVSHSLRTLEVRGWLVSGRSAGGKAEHLRLTPEGRKWASQFAGRCDEVMHHAITMSERAYNRLCIARSLLASVGATKIAAELRKRVRNVCQHSCHWGQ